MKIPITKPQLGKEEIRAVGEVIKSGWVVQGPKVAEFEKLIANFAKVDYAVATTSCTSALHTALRALDIGNGDEIIVPAFTFVATANACEYVGAKPIFVDIDLKTFNIDPAQIEAKITKKTKAIMPVHLFGLAAEMDEILKLAKKYSLLVIEDAACGLGTIYKGKHAGNFGKAAAFSFHPRKAITTGEGGMLLTNNKSLAIKAEQLRNHGASVSDLARHNQSASKLSEVDILGYNYRMCDIQAAIGVEQAKKARRILLSRQKLAKIYNQAFKDHLFLQPPYEPEGKSNHAYQSYVLLVQESSPISRDEISAKLAELGIATRQGTQNVPMLGYYRKKYGYKENDFPKSALAKKNTLTIPLYGQMTKKEQSFVIKNLLDIFNHV